MKHPSDDADGDDDDDGSGMVGIIDIIIAITIRYWWWSKDIASDLSFSDKPMQKKSMSLLCNTISLIMNSNRAFKLLTSVGRGGGCKKLERPRIPQSKLPNT